MAYYDVTYLSPLNIKGVMRAFPANSAEEAVNLSKIKITSSSQYSPDQFKILEVKLVPHTETNTVGEQNV